LQSRQIISWDLTNIIFLWTSCSFSRRICQPWHYVPWLQSELDKCLPVARQLPKEKALVLNLQTRNQNCTTSLENKTTELSTVKMNVKNLSSVVSKLTEQVQEVNRTAVSIQCLTNCYLKFSSWGISSLLEEFSRNALLSICAGQRQSWKINISYPVALSSELNSQDSIHEKHFWNFI